MRLLVSFLCVWSLNAFSLGGGDIIGNGGGVAESNFVHAYSRLYKLIDNCLSVEFCVRSEKEFYDLLKIREATTDNIKSIKRLKFSTPDKHPEIFFTHDVDVVRLAVTGSTPNSPIYVNLDMLYEIVDGKSYPALDYGQIVAILIHEIGHNVGIMDHTYLDYLGSLVRDLMEKKFESYNYVVGETIFNVNLMNFSDEMKISEFWVTWGEETFSITDKVYFQTSCKSGDKPFSIKFFNFHQERLIKKGSRSTQPLKVWAELICVNGPVSQSEYVDVGINLKTDENTSTAIVELELLKI